jgi:hypothetical protein
MKIEAQRKRTRDKIAWIEQAKKVVPDLVKPCSLSKGKKKHHHTNSSSDEESQGPQ